MYSSRSLLDIQGKCIMAQCVTIVNFFILRGIHSIKTYKFIYLEFQHYPSAYNEEGTYSNLTLYGLVDSKCVYFLLFDIHVIFFL